MLLRTAPLASALLLATGVSAFKDTAPFFLLSSHPLNSTTPIQSSQILPAKDVEDAILNSVLIKGCKADVTLVRQAGLTAADFHDMPRVKTQVDAVIERSGAAFIEVAEVLGAVDVFSLEQEIGRRCGDKVVRVVNEQGKKDVKSTGEMDIVAGESAAADTIVVADSKLASVLKEADKGKPYVVIFSGSSSTREVPPYEMDEAHPELHIDLRRDIESHDGRSIRRADGNNTKQGDLPLFETYQFFTPALFMGLGVSLLLFFILYVGVSAIANLEVSYAAFSKEMGPQAQKKQQ